ncbi:MAG TPA: PIN domain-containing protein [Segetibacter sp.]
MMFTTNSVFIASSLLVEYLKGTKTKLLNDIIATQEFVACINETVVSEFLLYFIAVNGNAAPKTPKASARISSIFRNYFNYNLLERFSFLSNDDNLFSLVPDFMMKYNLLPNDTIILATCKIHNITQLASHDSDFILPCKAEGIELLREE